MCFNVSVMWRQTEAEEIRGRWKKYIEELYDKEGKPTEEELKIEEEEEVDKDCVGPEEGLMESQLSY